jgi:hypothetical protein
VIHELNSEEWECGDDCLALICVSVTFIPDIFLRKCTRWDSYSYDPSRIRCVIMHDHDAVLASVKFQFEP